MGQLGREVKPHFYVNVADIETLESEVAYIACKSFKPDFYVNVADIETLESEVSYIACKSFCYPYLYTPKFQS